LRTGLNGNTRPEFSSSGGQLSLLGSQWRLRRSIAIKLELLPAANEALEAAAQAAGGYKVEEITKANAATAKKLELFLAELESK
jgi:hypothetical protein